jgi:hypothetical protein
MFVTEVLFCSQKAKKNELCLFLFLFLLALSCEAGFRRPRAKEGKKLARGRKKRNAPRNEQRYLKELEKS